VIAIVDYGLGNIGAFETVYRRLNIPAKAARTPADLEAADRIILPGVGAFDHAMELIEASGLRESLDKRIVEDRIPVLGVCVGMQILADASEEGSKAGLGWIDGQVRRLDVGALPLPHMGWNAPAAVDGEPLFAGLKPDAEFYFLHSYYFDADQPGDVVAFADYGSRFPCAVRRGNVMGVQFHPEKSHHNGVRLLKNFAEI
jgi:glutamine amidotransferase